MDKNEFIMEYGGVINEAAEAGFSEDAQALIGGLIAELENLNEIEADNPHYDPINVEQIMLNAIANAKSTDIIDKEGDEN